MGSDILNVGRIECDVLSGAFWSVTFCPGHFGKYIWVRLGCGEERWVL
uniref:Uncharacterized protein n=1 Tax=Meloidogyne enterolobii TaxID=390850 RepID=A0A6V7YBV6_MELEN|nr:unnamed protein product [Meloidogyne enterolobii]